MPFALLIIGAVMLISAAKGTTTQGPNGGPGLFTLLQSDFTGSDNFLYWFLVILVIGAIGYVPKLKPFSVAFLALVVIVLFLSKGNPSGVGGGFFVQLANALGTTQSTVPSTMGINAQLSLLSSGFLTSQSSLGGLSPSGANVLSVLGPQSTTPVSSPVTSTPTASSSLLPLPSSTDLSFPSLGIGA
jgi:hypothetical protein